MSAKDHGPVPAYARLAKWFGGAAVRTGTQPRSATYRFASLPVDTIKMGSHDASADTVAEVTVDTTHARPYVAHIRFISTAPFRVMLVAKVDRFVIDSTYATIADGRVFASGTDSNFTGSMLGKSGAQITRKRFTDIVPAH